jgi:hypothetical protein
MPITVRLEIVVKNYNSALVESRGHAVPELQY